MSTAVLIPCFNEEKTIGKVVRDFKSVLPEATIYVYDNNSTDDTAKIASEAGAVVRKEYRQGKGNVIRSMFREIDADCYIMVDGDDTYPADAARDLEKEVLENGADMVVGDRLSSTYFSENKRPFHNTGNVLVRSLINVFWKKESKKILDVMTGYRAFSKLFVKSFPVVSKGFEIETEMTIHALDKNFYIKNVPIQYRDRPEGSESKLNTYSDGFKVIKTIFRMFREYRPLEFFLSGSLIFFILSLILGVPVVFEYFETGLVPRFPSLIVSGIFLVISILVFFVGLILDVLRSADRKNFELHLITLREIDAKRK